MRSGENDRETLAALYLLLGEVSATLAKDDAAVSSYRTALSLNTGLSLPDGTSPKVAEPFVRARALLEGMSEAWRHELAPFGVRVVLLEPGAYATDIFGRNRNVARHAYDPDSPYAPWVHSLDDLFRRQVNKRKADPAEIGTAICDLVEHPNPALRHPMGPAARFRSLAVRLAPGLGKQVSAETKRSAAEGFDMLMAAAAMPRQQQLPNTLPRGAGNRTVYSYPGPFFPGPCRDPLAVAQGGDLDIPQDAP